MPFESYVKINGKKYRRGFTTGSAATAAAKAATSILFGDMEITEVCIETPAGIELSISLKDVEYTEDYVRVTVEKDAGDDPDVTDGLDICAKAEKIESGIEVSGGKGVGCITKPGLSVPVGKAAINPVPEQMIREAVAYVLPNNCGVKITIEVPEGEEVAEKTFNSNLGIVGGISILGTTGIVEPMSEKAYRESLALELKQAAAEEKKRIILVFGNYGRDMADSLGYPSDEVVRMSNFVGYILKECLELGIERLVLLGHIGKLCKVAGGIFNTHSKVADSRKEIIAAYTASIGGGSTTINKILASNTSTEAVKIIQEAGLERVFDILAERAVCRVKEYLKNDQVDIESIIFTLEEGILGSSGR